MAGEFVLGEVTGLDGNNYDTLTKLFHYRITRQPDRIIYTYKRGGNWIDVNWGEYGKIVKRASMAFQALGIERGDRISILSDINWEWYYLNMALVCIGAITVGIYHTDPPQQCKYILQHSDSKLVVAEDQEQVDKIFEIWDDLPLLKTMVVKKKFGQKGHPMCMTLHDFLELGSAHEAVEPGFFEKALFEARSKDVVTLLYTSGTTGPPKAVMLTHANALCAGHFQRTVRGQTEEDLSVDFMPMAHLGGQITSQLSRLYTNHRSVIAESWQDAMYNAWEHRPTFFTSTPRQFEKLYNTILSELDDSTWFQKMCYDLGISVGRKIIEYHEHGRTAPLHLRFFSWLSLKFIFHNIRERFGGRVNRLYSGGAPIAREIVEFFHIIGAPILETYGMTETTTGVTDSTLKECRVGAVGKPNPGIEIKIADDGEILVKSPTNCKGYFKDKEAAASLYEGEWLHTGDVGEFDKDGFLYITDRKKDIFITAGGKNVAPGNIENVMKTSKYINQCMVYGDRRKYLVALFTLDEDEIVKYARDNRIVFKDAKELTQLPEIRALIENQVKVKNKELARFETIKKFIILPEAFDQDKDEVTATEKVRRNIVTERFKEQLEALYEE